MEIPHRILRLVDEEDIRLAPEKFLMTDQCGFFACLQGQTKISIYNKCYHICRGTVALFHPFVKITFHGMTDNLKGFLGDMNLSKALPVINQALSVENTNTIRMDPIIRIKSRVFDNLVEKGFEYMKECDELEREMATTEICQPICKALLNSHNERVFLEVLNLYYLSKSKTVLPATSHDRVFQKFIMDLQQNYANHHDTMFYARRSSLSPKYFSAVVKQVSGAAPIDWIIQTIIAVAQNYLTDTSMTIKEIASMLGFPSQAFFCKYFKRYTSYSPKEYRINHRT